MLVKNVKISYEITFENENKADIIYNSLLPEFEKGFPGISYRKFIIEKNKIKIELHSSNISRIRAISNTINRWLISIKEINNI